MTATEAVTSGVGLGAGVGSTMLVRQQFDAANETTVARPSVLWGVTTGALGVGLPWLMDMDGMVGDLLMDYGTGALVGGVFSAFNPVGGAPQLPTL